MDLVKQVEKQYGHRLRLRVCGICIENEKLLLVHHKGVGPEGELWSPPGGGMEYGSTAPDNLKREFLEETGLVVAVEEQIFVHEYLEPPLHAFEIFYIVKVMGGTLYTGYDPESEREAQLIQHVSFISWEEIKQKPPAHLHQILKHSSSLQDLLCRRGYYKFSV
ncbi:NUDIX domain-containing protein [Cesiribacter sp. SM1]|uniref:NUDIX domain-containing protein n=1 Tax=Cesiribacter sp. SM1 TaxID=2861196 RepID=UPI001CD2EA8A|nr:NUDIX hydrolase [Cesiribacter sp. SM1]